MVSVSCTPKPFCCEDGFCVLYSKTILLWGWFPEMFVVGMVSSNSFFELSLQIHNKQSSESQHTTNFEFFSCLLSILNSSLLSISNSSLLCPFFWIFEARFRHMCLVFENFKGGFEFRKKMDVTAPEVFAISGAAVPPRWAGSHRAGAWRGGRRRNSFAEHLSLSFRIRERKSVGLWLFLVWSCFYIAFSHVNPMVVMCLCMVHKDFLMHHNFSPHSNEINKAI